MTSVNERKDLLRFARRARARQGLVRGVEVALRTLFYALCTALIALVAARVFGFPILVKESVAVGVGIVLVSGLIALFFPRKDLLEAAADVDARAGWKERLSSALALPALSHPMEFALIDDVRAKLKEQRPSRLFPLRAPRELKFSPIVAIAIAAVAYLMPQVDLFGTIAKEREKEKDKKEVAQALEKLLDRRKKEGEKNDKLPDKIKDALKKIDALAAELQKTPPAERTEALAKISKLSDELKQLKDELAKSASLADKLQKAAGEKGGDTGELGKLLREGKLHEAVQELAKMRNALQEGKLTPAEREKLRKQMENLAEKLSKEKDLSEIEKKLAQAMKGLNEGDEKQMDGLQQELGKMDGELDEAQQMAEALKDLENLSDALAKGEGDCPNCGKKKNGKDGCDGKGG